MRVVLDACVLYPPSLRDLILTLAGLDAFELRWSHQILEEFERNVLTDFPDINPKRFRAHTIAAMTTNFPDAFLRENDAEIEIIGVHPKDTSQTFATSPPELSRNMGSERSAQEASSPNSTKANQHKSIRLSSRSHADGKTRRERSTKFSNSSPYIQPWPLQ